MVLHWPTKKKLAMELRIQLSFANVNTQGSCSATLTLEDLESSKKGNHQALLLFFDGASNDGLLERSTLCSFFIQLFTCFTGYASLCFMMNFSYKAGWM